MPIAKVRLPDGRIGRFEVPEGTTEQDVLAFIETQMKLPDQAPQAPTVTQEPKAPESVFDTPPPGLATGEAATSLVSSLGSGILSGLAGLRTLGHTGDIDRAKTSVEQVSEALTYQPRTSLGKSAVGAAAIPAMKLKEAGEYIADPIAEAGYPNVAATVASATEAAPLLVSAALPKVLPKGVKPVISKATEAIGQTKLAKVARETKIGRLAGKTKKAVTESINQAIKPSIKGKKTAEAVKNYENQALTAVEKIVKSKDEITFLDESGAPTKRLPESIEDFQSALSQTKKKTFNEYDALTKETDAFTQVRPVKYPLKPGEKVIFDAEGRATGIGTKEPFKISGQEVVKELDTILDSAPLRATSPETLRYAQKRIETYSKEAFSAAEAQEAIQILNKSMDAFHKDPSVATYGKSLVDSLIVNNMRKKLDTLINKTTGKEYAALKKEYAALKTIEADVAKAANIERNKLTGGILPDFTDIMAGHQIVSGLASFSPSAIAGGATIKALSAVRKMLKNPNRKIKKMFKTVDENLTKSQQLKAKSGE